MLLAAAIACLVTALVVPILMPVLASRSVFDHPNWRSSHSQPTLRAGGIAIIAGCFTGLMVTTHHDVAWLRAVFGVTAMFGMLGLVEDIHGLSVSHRLLAQIVITVAAVPALLEDVRSPWYWWLAWGCTTAVWLLGFVNIFNFMDGVNGISATEAVITGSAFAIAGYLRAVYDLEVTGLIIAGSALGFLPYNFPKARLFLGDVGSYFMGAWLAAGVVLGVRSGLPPEAVIGPLSVYLADAGFTLAGRVHRGEPWRDAHHDHVYQRLVDLGWSHRKVTGLVALVATATSALGAVSFDASPGLRATADLALVALLAGYLALPRHISRQNEAGVPT